MSENILRGFDETPVILFGGNPKYRLVLCKGRLTLEWQDLDAAGQVRWTHINGWTPSMEINKDHEEIAFSILLEEYRKTREQLEKLTAKDPEFPAEWSGSYVSSGAGAVVRGETPMRLRPEKVRRFEVVWKAREVARGFYPPQVSRAGLGEPDGA